MRCSSPSPTSIPFPQNAPWSTIFNPNSFFIYPHKNLINFTVFLMYPYVYYITYIITWFQWSCSLKSYTYNIRHILYKKKYLCKTTLQKSYLIITLVSMSWSSIRFKHTASNRLWIICIVNRMIFALETIQVTLISTFLHQHNRTADVSYL